MEQGACPGAAIIDGSMPGGLSGPETFARLRAILPDLPVILCSGYSPDTYIDMVTAHARTTFLGKPYKLDALGKALENILG